MSLQNGFKVKLMFLIHIYSYFNNFFHFFKFINFNNNILIDNSNIYAGFLMFVGILGMIGFSFSFLIFYMKKKGINTNQLFKFSKMT